MAARVHTTPIRVRYAECDSMQFVHHMKYVEYFELGRTDLIRVAAKSYGAFEAEGVLLPVIQLTIRYHRPAHYDDELRIETSVRNIAKASVDFANRVLSADGKIVHCEGEVGLACINPQGKPQRIPPELLTPLTAWLEGPA
ncbi:MAG TPA: thioesterase family protein [Planctomycetota bacterium]|nr:thioesterase family protein [Planctomycetota bacterium]